MLPVNNEEFSHSVTNMSDVINTKENRHYLSSALVSSITASCGERLVPTPPPRSTTPPMESTSALTKRDPELHPCIPITKPKGVPVPLIQV